MKTTPGQLMTNNILNSLEEELIKVKLMRTLHKVNDFEYKRSVAKVEELYEQALCTTSKSEAAKLLVKIMK